MATIGPRNTDQHEVIFSDWELRVLRIALNRAARAQHHHQFAKPMNETIRDLREQVSEYVDEVINATSGAELP